MKMPTWEMLYLRTLPVPCSSSFLSLTKKSHSKCRESTDPEKPISGGFYRLEKGTPLVYTYTYDEIKIIVDGHFYISGMFFIPINACGKKVIEKERKKERERERERERRVFQLGKQANSNTQMRQAKK